jgi:hypothetical protein
MTLSTAAVRHRDDRLSSSRAEAAGFAGETGCHHRQRFVISRDSGLSCTTSICHPEAGRACPSE